MDFTIPGRYRDRLRIGTCSWKYDTWKGLVYETGTKYHADDYLVDYSRHFGSVEVDQWFWSLFPPEPKLPDLRTVSTYAVSVPSDFSFTIKAPTAITLTHYYAKQPPRYRALANKPNDHFLSVELLERFLETLEPLRGRLGPIMFQFEYLNERKMPSLDAFLECLDGFFARAPAGYRYAVETRNPEFVSEAYFAFLQRRNIAHVYLDGYHMPPIGSVFRNFDPQTAECSIVRLHGPDRQGIEKVTGKNWNRIVAPQDRGIETAVDIVCKNAGRSVTTYLNVNNHYEGSAPLTIERFLDALKKAGG